MSSRVKKDRRASGVKFVKAAKVPTPLEDRREFRTVVSGAHGTLKAGSLVPRSEKQLARVRDAWRVGGDAA